MDGAGWWTAGALWALGYHLVWEGLEALGEPPASSRPVAATVFCGLWPLLAIVALLIQGHRLTLALLGSLALFLVWWL